MEGDIPRIPNVRQNILQANKDNKSKWTVYKGGDGQGGLACCDSWGRKELDTTERLI